MAKKKRYNYIRKKLAPGTWFRIFTTVLSYLLLVACIVISTLKQGNGPMIVGALGLSSIIMAVYTILDMFSRIKDPEMNYIPVRIAGVTSLIIIIIWLFLIGIGLTVIS
ncbi:hypothetical protein [Oribacterium sp. WCC10]|uniref:hypothetical protein n=1 Tax=Oribacterium sp. WCC10 TaxID=1855343 RepID=UPI0008E3DCA6|nr:hypothetical protein [Oribacterium sp. WCC10]SFG31631.1 hypothetical protein SAMN05216356_105170 [Oribacterium sp. WCC10]